MEVEVEVSTKEEEEATPTLARLATPVVVSATWQKIAPKAKSAITVVVWDMLAVIATKPPKPKFVTGANNPVIFLAIAQTNPSKRVR